MMIQLGNLTVAQMESRSGVTFPDELKEFMAGSHQDQASNVQPGKWHCFDLPFFLMCGDMETAQKIYDYLSPLTSEFKEDMQIGVAS